ncbi:hypothetical protein M1N19_03645 [Dehalococcoidia bacterium]|nr:hypothetical protein [Dehalococcoidia bacterium]
MNIIDYVPGVGLAKQHTETQLEYHRGEISFQEAVFDVVEQAIIASAISIGSFALLPNYMGAKRLQNVVTKGPVALAAVGLAIAVHEVTKPSATVEAGPYRSYKVTPKLGFL